MGRLGKTLALMGAFVGAVGLISVVTVGAMTFLGAELFVTIFSAIVLVVLVVVLFGFCWQWAGEMD